ncbi:MAG: HutP family protein [Clostridia bacterium]|nr:HutP family protein [Clostridia bacterium]
MTQKQPDSRDVARAAITLAMTTSREDESAQKQRLIGQGIKSAASDFGGDFTASVMKVIERAVVIARRECLIGEKEHEEGAVAGAAHDAVTQIADKAMGLNIGGKIGVARAEGHVAVAIFFTVGLVHLNEVCVGLGHRAV